MKKYKFTLEFSNARDESGVVIYSDEITTDLELSVRERDRHLRDYLRYYGLGHVSWKNAGQAALGFQIADGISIYASVA